MSLQVTNVRKQYTIAGEKRFVLDGVDLEVKSGEIVSITGQSGCGKTTLLNVISGLTPPGAGEVILNGRRMHYLFDLLSARRRNREIGFIFQTFRLLPDETVLENVLLPARIRGEVSSATREYSMQMLGKLRIYKYRATRAGLLSGGQKQRVAIARALVNNPSLILADEPTANLDKQTSVEIFDILRGLGNEGKAVLVITHTDYMHEASDRVYNMDRGRLEVLR